MNPANQNAAPAGQQQGQQQPQRPNMMKMVLIYMAINYLTSYFFKGNNQAQAPTNAFQNVFKNDEPLEFQMFITKSTDFPYKETPVWEEKDIHYNYDKENLREKTFVFDIDELLGADNNPSLFAHFVLQSTRDPTTENYTDFEPYLIQRATIDLIDWKDKSKIVQKQNLLGALTDDSQSEPATKNTTAIESNDTEKVPFLKSKIWVQLVHDTNPYMPGHLPPNMSPKFIETAGGNRIYVPIIDVGQFWLRKKDFIRLDNKAENKTVNTTFSFNTYWFYKFAIESQMNQANNMTSAFGMVADNGMDEIKEIILDTHPALTIITFVVSMLHSIFEFLALKNDIAFWKNVESHKGLSLRSLWVNLFTEIVIIFYLFDNETSYIIVLSSIAGLGVTIWKIFKTMKFKKREDGKFPFYSIEYQEAYKSTTMEYDKAASKYLMWLLIPLLIGYTIYSLIYHEHKGWFSFVVQTLVGFIYVFGFIEMTPQLYINYKLKSVEHLPWRVMAYKFLNTIVDDLFAFVITMPWLKRLSCFRDDIIFIIYLYQRWIYKVDKNRDEFGNTRKEEEKQAEIADKKTQAPARAVQAEDSNVTQRNVNTAAAPTESAEKKTTGNASPSKGGQGSKMRKKKVE